MEKLLSSSYFTNVLVSSPEQYRYGTAGFRMTAKFMPAAACRLGPLFVERASSLSHEKPDALHRLTTTQREPVFGVMVTASHNPAADNGLKIVEPPHAHMLAAESEQRATQLARAFAPDDFKKLVDEILSAVPSPISFTVIVGWDTRPSCKEIVDALSLGIEAVGGKVVKAGQMSTPMLHWCVEKANQPQPSLQQLQPQQAPLVPPLSLYLDERFTWFSEAVQRDLKNNGCFNLADDNKNNNNNNNNNSNNNNMKQQGEDEIFNRHIIVDCANGVGSFVLKDLVKRFEAHPIPGVKYTFQLINTDTDSDENLNDRCGADYVQKQLTLPRGFSDDEFARLCLPEQQCEGNSTNSSSEEMTKKSKKTTKKTVLFYSLDGDADRLVAGAVGRTKDSPSSSPPTITILEGDRFTALFASVLFRAGAPSSSLSATCANDDDELSYGVVQTAYANGASTQYLNSIDASHLKTEFALTGVKYVHAAAEKYDVGLYFESNGHGTVLVSEKASSSSSSMTPQGLTVTRICSQSCGDAIANLLATEYALLALRWTTQKWLDLYTDLPCVQKKVPVPDPSKFKCEAGNEQKLILPEGAQEKIESVVKELVESSDEYRSKASMFRAFVRPSGTESVVRLYVEGCSVGAAKELTEKLEKLVKQMI